MDEKLDQFARESLHAAFIRSVDAFEKNLTYITAGTITLSVTFVDKITPFSPAVHKCYLIIAWTALILSLLINLISHKYSTDKILKTLGEHDREEEGIPLKVQYRNKIGNIFNWCSIGLLIFGMAALVIYASLNLLK